MKIPPIFLGSHRDTEGHLVRIRVFLGPEPFIVVDRPEPGKIENVRTEDENFDDPRDGSWGVRSVSPPGDGWLIRDSLSSDHWTLWSRFIPLRQR
ncbi:hypothetical protein N0Q91_09135 [Sinorhizobium sp. K101]|uniref:hypothetical protein n=1 Tax=Sinorhizobium sp. K101 TaxID=2976820 RepID=UPI0023D81DA8|nr:hypothetical protein [Sinorhizobium sp. K101]WEJ16703.1 hypothetical protein N0Q91_09135 [Sinorhizobium sp. K101]